MYGCCKFDVHPAMCGLLAVHTAVASIQRMPPIARLQPCHLPVSHSPRRRLDALLEGEQGPAPLSMLQQIRTLVDSAFASMLCYSARRNKEQAAAAVAAALAAEAGSGGAADGEATSGPASAGAQAPLSLEGLRSLLLQRVPVAVADLRKRHAEADQPEARRQLARRLLLELLLRFCICAYGEALSASGGATADACASLCRQRRPSAGELHALQRMHCAAANPVPPLPPCSQQPCRCATGRAAAAGPVSRH